MAYAHVNKIVKVDKNLLFSSKYRSKSFIKVKLIIAFLFITMFLLLLFVHLLSDPINKLSNIKIMENNKNINTTKKHTKAINTIPIEVRETSLPIYGVFNATSCTSNSYYRYKECFDDTTSLNTIIAKYQLNDNTYEVNNINFREGQSIIDEINTYRIMASFKNSNCILNFISSFDNKSVIIELFSMERESENSAILNN